MLVNVLIGPEVHRRKVESEKAAIVDWLQ